MKLFVNTKTKECGMYEPSDLDDEYWIEAPKGTQAVYLDQDESDKIFFYKIKDNTLFLWIGVDWCISTFTPELLAESPFLYHAWGTLPDFEF